jgi:LmbE family N-acetylglucosaminyl deacetylase
MSKQLTILAAAAHPDDVELQCAGTLIRYIKEGHRVVIGVACTGNVGTKSHTGPEIEAIRAKEAENAAKVIGAELMILGHKDGEVWLDNPTWKEYVDLIRKVDPDVIITHDEADYVHDHSNVGQMAYRAAIWASTANIPDTKLPTINHIPTVFYFETVGAIRVQEPDYYVDITEEFQQKLDAFRCHESQHGDFLEKQFGVSNWFDYLDALGKLRGFQCGAKYAEAFRIAPTWPNQKTYRLLPPVQYGPR